MWPHDFYHLMLKPPTSQLSPRRLQGRASCLTRCCCAGDLGATAGDENLLSRWRNMFFDAWWIWMAWTSDEFGRIFFNGLWMDCWDWGTFDESLGFDFYFADVSPKSQKEWLQNNAQAVQQRGAWGFCWTNLARRWFDWEIVRTYACVHIWVDVYRQSLYMHIHLYVCMIIYVYMMMHICMLMYVNVWHRFVHIEYIDV